MKGTANLEAKQLVDDAKHLLGQEVAGYIIIVPEGFPVSQTAAVHLRVHDLQGRDGLEKRKVAVFHDLTRGQVFHGIGEHGGDVYGHDAWV